MTANTQPGLDLLERMRTALNQHDLEAFLACFDPAYQSEQPAHPDRQFTGRDQVRKNWSGIFNGVPDFRAEVLRSAVAGDVIWSEWDWQGTRLDGTMFHMRGVVLMGESNGLVAWGRLYMEPVETAGAGIDAAVRTMAEGRQAE
jgi:ketosteroid isomerase-like protein